MNPDEPLRSVEGSTFYSRDPELTVQIVAPLDFVGRLKFDIAGLADVDTFLFADVSSGIYTCRLAIHFESQRPDRDFTYNFPEEPTVALGDHEYYYDAFFGPQAKMVEENPNADFSKVELFLRSKGLTGWKEAMWHRFMRTLDSSRRSELLILYHEDLGAAGVTVADLGADGPKAHLWPELSAALKERALGSFQIVSG